MKRMLHRVVSTLNCEIVTADPNADVRDVSRPVAFEDDRNDLNKQISSKSSPSEISKESDSTNSRVELLMKLAQYTRDLCSNEFNISNITSHNNGDYIIPTYYMNEKNTKGKLFDIDFYWTILDSIRNLRELTPHQLELLKTLSHEKLIEIIHEYDHILKTFIPSLIME